MRKGEFEESNHFDCQNEQLYEDDFKVTYPSIFQFESDLQETILGTLRIHIFLLHIEEEKNMNSQNDRFLINGQPKAAAMTNSSGTFMSQYFNHSEA